MNSRGDRRQAGKLWIVPWQKRSDNVDPLWLAECCIWPPWSQIQQWRTSAPGQVAPYHMQGRSSLSLPWKLKAVVDGLYRQLKKWCEVVSRIRIGPYVAQRLIKSTSGHLVGNCEQCNLAIAAFFSKALQCCHQPPAQTHTTCWFTNKQKAELTNFLRHSLKLDRAQHGSFAIGAIATCCPVALIRTKLAFGYGPPVAPSYWQGESNHEEVRNPSIR